MKMTQEVWGVHVNPYNGQDLTEGWLEPGMEYEDLGICGYDYFGNQQNHILIEGYTYRVRAADLIDGQKPASGIREV